MSIVFKIKDKPNHPIVKSINKIQSEIEKLQSKIDELESLEYKTNERIDFLKNDIRLMNNELINGSYTCTKSEFKKEIEKFNKELNQLTK